jgi:hypothetical protein
MDCKPHRIADTVLRRDDVGENKVLEDLSRSKGLGINLECIVPTSLREWGVQIHYV